MSTTAGPCTPFLALAAVNLALLAACAPPEPEPRKELYVEPVAGEPEANASGLEAWPLSASEEPRTWVALRTLRRDRQEAVELLARTLEVWSPAEDGQQPAPIDLREQTQRPRPPALLFFLPAVEERRETAAYLGHSAFAVRGLGRPAVFHHVRFKLINREGEPIRIPVASIACESQGGVRGKDGQKLVLDRKAVADDTAHELEELEVGPGQERLFHLFFQSPRLDSALRLSWRVEVVPPPGEEPARGPWDFQVALQRRYDLVEPEFSELERIVARGDPLPRAPRKVDPFREPRLEPVPAPPD